MRITRIIFSGLLLTSLPTTLLATDGFVEKSDEIVTQMLGNEKKINPDRSFVVVEPETRAIAVRKKDNAGEEQTVVVEVPTESLDPVARLKVEFDVGSAQLRSESYRILGELGRALQDERVIDHKVCIAGHTDSDGAESYNLQLSYDRAHSVQNFLLDTFGLGREKIAVFGYGEALPIAGNSSNYNKQLNRRVEVSLNCAGF